MKKLLLHVLAVLFPWLVFLIEDQPLYALIALVAQATFIGWLPATIWAWNTVNRSASPPPVQPPPAPTAAPTPPKKTEE